MTSIVAMNRVPRDLALRIRHSPAVRAHARRLARATQRFGIRIAPYRGLGSDPDADLVELLRPTPAPVIFDVGANTGQTVHRLRSLISNGSIHAFEPSPGTFRQLAASVRGLGEVKLIEAGVGRVDCEQTLLENEYSEMSSFLVPGDAAWGMVVRKTRVRMVTLDTYCQQAGIDHIDLLKIDTQGYDLEVLRGAEELLARGGIRVVQLEVIFSDMYEGRPALDETYRYMCDHGFRLLSFYDIFVADGSAAWCDAIFVRHADGGAAGTG